MRAVCLMLVMACAATLAACSGRGMFEPEYEYEEELYLDLDGSATLNVYASVPSLVALRGVDLDPRPRARVDREHVRRLFEGPGARVTSVSLSRRHGRRFVHVSVDVDDVTALSRLPPFAWSTYRFDRHPDVFEFRQTVGPAAAKEIPGVGWAGQELVAFRVHLPSEIPYQNAPEGIQRGNILEWDQPLAARLRGEPLDMQANLEPDSILYTTLVLFGSTIVAAVVTVALLLWWVARRGRAAEMAESRP
jgi:hypothetical protein